MIYDEQAPYLEPAFQTQLQRLSGTMEGIAREAFARLALARAADPRWDASRWRRVTLEPSDGERRESDRLLLLLQCAGGPRVHGEWLDPFEFLTLVALIPGADLDQIRSEEELSGWLDRTRTLVRCGVISSESAEQAWRRAQGWVASRFRSSDLESQWWCEAFCWLAGQAWSTESQAERLVEA